MDSFDKLIIIPIILGLIMMGGLVFSLSCLAPYSNVIDSNYDWNFENDDLIFNLDGEYTNINGFVLSTGTADIPFGEHSIVLKYRNNHNLKFVNAKQLLQCDSDQWYIYAFKTCLFGDVYSCVCPVYLS